MPSTKSPGENLANLRFTYGSSGLTGEEWTYYLWERIVDTLFPETRSGALESFSVLDICNNVLNRIKDDFSDISSNICKFGVFYFFGDLAGFIAAQN